MKTGIVAACALAAVAVPSAAEGNVATYGGSIAGAPDAGIAMDAKITKKGVPKKILAIRASKVPAHCEQSGDLTLTINLNRKTATLPDGSPFSIAVKENHKFRFSYTDPTYGWKKAISGKFTGGKGANKRISGKFTYGNHYPADDTYPEETCQTDVFDYRLRIGGPDVEPPQPLLARR